MLSITVLYFLLLEQEFSLEHEVSTKKLFHLLIVTQTRRKDIILKGFGLLFFLKFFIILSSYHEYE